MYVAKWLLIVHLKKMHDLIAKKGKLGHPSIHEGGFNTKTINP
jgi:hypothetical protein